MCGACTGSEQTILCHETQKDKFLYKHACAMLTLSMSSAACCPFCFICFPYLLFPVIQADRRSSRASPQGQTGHPRAGCGSWDSVTAVQCFHGNDLAIQAECRGIFTLPIFFFAVNS